jgi:hypothetical protein
MKAKSHRLFIALALLALSILNPNRSTAFAQGTAFTYEGQLQDGGSPAHGTYNLMFTPYSASGGGFVLSGPVTTNGVIITNGLFTVTIDFGATVFTGQTNWLQIGVESNGISSFTTLTPRQQIMPTPYAIYAENSGMASQLSMYSTLPATQLSGVIPTGILPGFQFSTSYCICLLDYRMYDLQN